MLVYGIRSASAFNFIVYVEYMLLRLRKYFLIVFVEIVDINRTKFYGGCRNYVWRHLMDLSWTKAFLFPEILRWQHRGVQTRTVEAHV